MGELWGKILESFRELLPFEVVLQWKRANYYLCGHLWRDVGPGLWPVIPLLLTLEPISLAVAPVTTGRLDLTLVDGTLASIDVIFLLRVMNPQLAQTALESHEKGAPTLLKGMVSDKLQRLERVKFNPDNRTELMASLRSWARTLLAPYGLGVESAMFGSFVIGVRAIRLFTEQTAPAAWD